MRAGEIGEILACQYLENHGLKVLAKNWRVRVGEIDLIMRDGNTIVFVEVKYRSSDDFGHPIELVPLWKQRRIILAAQYYLARFPQDCDCRFDVIGILGKKIYWVKGAFA